MKITHKTPKQITFIFEELPCGQAFKTMTNDGVLMKVESIFCDTRFNAVRLLDGTLTVIDDTSVVIPLKATVVVD
jgi:hypothetical protein